MATALSQRFYDSVRVHMEKGVPCERLPFTADQRERVLQCEVAFKMKMQRPWMDLKQYFSNALGHTHNEIINDIRIVNFMMKFINESQREVDKFEVAETARRAMRNSAQNGDDATGIKAGALLTKLEGLDQPDEQAGGEMLADLPSLITTRVSDKYHNKKDRDEEEMDAIRKKWGVHKDEWMEATEIKESEYVDFEETSNDNDDDTASPTMTESESNNNN